MESQTNYNKDDDVVKIPPIEVEFSPTVRLFDPNGRVFFWNGEVLRGIYQERVEFVNKLFDEGLVEAIVNDRLLIPTERTNYFLEGFGLVLRHEPLDFYVNSYELPVSYLIDAYKTYLRLYIYLYSRGYTLIDGHPGNLAPFKDGLPIFIDFGSIVAREESPRTGLFESFSYFYYRLCLSGKGVPATVLRKFIGELNRYEYLMLVSPLHRLLYRSLSKLESVHVFRRFGYLLKRLIYSENAEHFLSVSGVTRLLTLAINKSKGEIYWYPQLDRTASRVLRKILKIKPRSEKTYWSEYHDTVFTGSSVSQREQTVIDQVKRISPNGVLDIGANAGFISDSLYPYCNFVLSVDFDEDAVDKNFRRLKKDNLNKKMYPIVKNVVGMNDKDRKRYKQDVVIALALTHHLSLGQGYSFEYISKLFSDITSKLLIVEFVPNGLGINKPQPNPLPGYYNLDNFVKCLEKNFAIVENLGIKTEADNSPRYMLVCQKKNL